GGFDELFVVFDEQDAHGGQYRARRWRALTPGCRGAAALFHRLAEAVNAPSGRARLMADLARRPCGASARRAPARGKVGPVVG
ncbi:hypothetical protein ACXWPN_09840, partial [Streptococcus pyogenes]